MVTGTRSAPSTASTAPMETVAVPSAAWSSIACSVAISGSIPIEPIIGSSVRMPRMSGNCCAIFTKNTLSPTSVCRAKPSRGSRSISSRGRVKSETGKPSTSWMLAILLTVGEPSGSRAGMWQAWQLSALAPAPWGRGPSGLSPVR